MALAVDTEVPVPGGLTTVADLTVGQRVFGYDGGLTAVTEVSPPEPGEDCREIRFATGERVVADGEQSWQVDQRDLPGQARWTRSRSTGEVAAELARHGPGALAIRTSGAVHLPDRRVPIDPYLLGVWLGAGVERLSAITGAGPDLINALKAVGVRVFSSRHDDLHWVAQPGEVRRGEDLRSRLRQLGVLDHKHLPTVYLRSGDQQRRRLLAGLLDAGGEVARDGEVVFAAPCRQLVLDVHQLVASLGLRPAGRLGRAGFEMGVFSEEPVFGIAALDARQRARSRIRKPLVANARPRRPLLAAIPVASTAVRRIRVAAEDGSFLVGRSFLPVPGAVSTVTLALRAEQASS
jgi:replicative DNA helicase